MEHWFDRATKFVAGASVARRDVLRNAAMAGIGALLPELSWSQERPRPNPRSPASNQRGPGANPPQSPHTIVLQPPKKPTIRVLGACHFQFEGPTTVLSYATEMMAGGMPISLRMQLKTQGLRHAAPNGPATPAIGASHFLEITSGNQLILRMDAAFAPAPLHGAKTSDGTVSFSYGPSIKGVQSAEINVRNGSLSGSVDKRPVVPMPAGPGLNQSAVRFTDGRPAPSVSLPGGLEAAVKQVLAKAQGELKACGKLPVRPLELAPEKQVMPPRRNLAQAGLAMVDAIDPGRNTIWGGGSSDDCISCGGSCDQDCNWCVAGAALSAILCGPCAAAEAAGCFTAVPVCWAKCFIPGNACCGTTCFPLDCCDKGQQCCGSDGCCDQGQICNGYNSTCCVGEQAVPCENGCCSPNTTCCGYNCCPQGTVCLDTVKAVCCAQSQACGHNCCAKGEFCIDKALGLCCPHPNMINCNGVCCLSASRCINPGMCCPTPNMINCNGVCCSSTSRCINHGTICCDAGIVCGNNCCGIADGPCCNGVCCAANQLCVAGKCQTAPCPSGQVPCPWTPGQCCPPTFLCCEGKLCCDPSKTECCGPRGCVPKGTCIQ